MRVTTAVLCGFLALNAFNSVAQTYPSKPVRIIVPFSAGSGSDIFARTLAPKFTEAWGQQIVVENREGAGGLVGAQVVAKSTPDGYTLLLAAIAWSVAPYVYAKPPYDATRDFGAIGRIGFIPNVLIVHPTLRVNDARDLIRLAKSKPGQLDYSSSGGKGAATQLFMEYFKSMAGVAIVEVPYKNTAQSYTDVISGQVMMSMPILIAVLPHINAGRLKALAVTSRKPSPVAPDIPTMAESADLPEFEAVQWQGLVGPAGIPQDIVSRISAALNRALAQPDVRSRLTTLGVEIAPTTPAEFANYVKADTAHWSKLIKALGIRVD